MSLENRPIEYGVKGFSWTNESMLINVPKDKPHPKVTNILLAAGLVFGGYQLANPEKASAFQDPVYPQTDQGQLQCEPIMANGLGATNGIPPELQGRTTCFDVNGQQESVIFYCDQVLKPDSPLAALDGNSTNQNPLCLEGSLDINGNGVSDYNPIIPNADAINGLKAPEAVTTPTPPAPTPESGVGDLLCIGGLGVLGLGSFVFRGFLRRSFGTYQSPQEAHDEGLKKGLELGGVVKKESEAALAKQLEKERKKALKRRGIR